LYIYIFFWFSIFILFFILFFVLFLKGSRHYSVVFSLFPLYLFWRFLFGFLMCFFPTLISKKLISFSSSFDKYKISPTSYVRSINNFPRWFSLNFPLPLPLPFPLPRLSVYVWVPFSVCECVCVYVSWAYTEKNCLQLLKLSFRFPMSCYLFSLYITIYKCVDIIYFNLTLAYQKVCTLCFCVWEMYILERIFFGRGLFRTDIL